MKVSFVIPGKPCSNNQVTRRVGDRSVKSAESREYQTRVNVIASAAMMKAHLRPFTGPVAVTINAFNVRIDIDNLPKVALDGMQGAVYDNDKQVVALHLGKLTDATKGQSLAITVESLA